jgi:pSer/pThr/pTyr-binding forkhead associated (FHA) protein
MIQLHVLNGAAAGRRFEADKFPITVGRSADCAFVLNDAGVFDRHFEIRFSPEGFTLHATPHAVVMVNDARCETALLRNGDTIIAGCPKIQFWLGAMKQRGLRLRETFAWMLIATIVSAQIYLLARLLSLTH